MAKIMGISKIEKNQNYENDRQSKGAIPWECLIISSDSQKSFIHDIHTKINLILAIKL